MFQQNEPNHKISDLGRPFETLIFKLLTTKEEMIHTSQEFSSLRVNGLVLYGYHIKISQCQYPLNTSLGILMGSKQSRCQKTYFWNLLIYDLLDKSTSLVKKQNLLIYTHQLVNMAAAGLYGTFVQEGKDIPSGFIQQDANQPHCQPPGTPQWVPLCNMQSASHTQWPSLGATLSLSPMCVCMLTLSSNLPLTPPPTLYLFSIIFSLVQQCLYF